LGALQDRIKGKIKQVMGSIRGHRGEQAEGIADETKGKLKEKIEQAKHEAREHKHE
jgi:uncharacterized protein YjbJ (UPF0337 family)